MASWQEIEKDSPAFAAKVKARFEAGTNKTIATLRRDGSPRISGTELGFDAGEITFGSMSGSMKLLDVRRDPRIAIHSPTLEPPPDHPERWPGDAKLAGTAVEMPVPADSPFPDSGYFRVDVREVSLTYVGDPADHLVIESWDTEHGYRRRTRK
ncbi:pyridoxamine 5'-phosphate oxidase family protein [Couchioplanes caeruleus]|uniref:Pyridoxamine 5-phosphate oxidase n=2 Tax=Couchioplanes caeruleus TaxID=56438 RepID=A0A1K0FCH3_9ACTN|nr:pyridoxamine 5'-phosphate oxidase family protein [Couchioplanes caeruleus]OJF10448.1 pyridoxamine 5-phosphate oxidase [Couchioplanes caeruleus subsp. caeruleus]ROP32520.1 pyridoxamine 5'-phosphate oxidase [Couchioplanes caeruleus]